MPVVGVYEARTRFSELVDRVARGERFVITKHGVPVAVLEPAKRTRKQKPEDVIAAIEEFARTHSLSGLKLKDLIAEGRV